MVQKSLIAAIAWYGTLLAPLIDRERNQVLQRNIFKRKCSRIEVKN